MLSGELYYAFDEALVKEREVVKDLLHTHNTLRPSQVKERAVILERLLGALGKESVVEQPFYCDYGYNIYAGNQFFANYGCTILDEAPVRFGDNVLLAPHVSIYTVGHPLNAERRRAGLEFALPVTIGNNVWIGGNTVILPGVTIGDNTIIGAGSVVTKSIPANVVAVGNPCRVLREVSAADR